MQIVLNTLPAGRSEEIIESLDPLQKDTELEWKPLDLKVDLQTDNQGSTFYFHGRISCRGRFVCDRGLEWFEDTLSSEFRVIASFDHHRFEGADEEEVALLEPGVNEFDIGPWVRDSILLAIPISHVCGPECPEGTALQKALIPPDEPDERWSKLKDLFKEE